MNRAEMSGWAQVVIGLAGLYFTVTNSSPALDALTRMGTGQGLPAEFQGAQGFIKVFLLILVLTVLLALVLIGLAILLAAVFRGLGSMNPNHGAFAMVAALLFGSCGITLSVFGSPVWVFAILFMLSCLVLAGVAAVDSEGEGFWGALFLLGAASVFVGGFAMIPMTAEPVSAQATEATANSLHSGSPANATR